MTEKLFEVEEIKNLTPMVRQYFSIKEKHKDKLLLFRLGDFYELFGDDAYEASKTLNIVLTSRNDLPMCGFPAHAAQNYIYKLIKSGYKVAICEQLEDASMAKGIVRRGVTQIITPGTVIDVDILESKSNNFLMEISEKDKKLYCIFGDISTGEILIEKIPLTDTLEKISSEDEIYQIKKEIRELFSKYKPSEILISNSMLSQKIINDILKGIKNTTITSYPEWFFNEEECSKIFDETVENNEIKEKVSQEEKPLIGAVIRYFKETQIVDKIAISSISQIDNRKYLEIDEFSIRNLELITNLLDGTKKYTLLDVLDDTVTPMGGRLLKRMLLNPSTDIKVINERLDKVDYFFYNIELTKETREHLSKISDIERLINRIFIKKALPKELINLKESISSFFSMINRISDYIVKFHQSTNDEFFKELSTVYNLIGSTIVDDPSNNFEGGQVIKEGVNEELDELRKIIFNTKDFIEKIQERERLKTGIQSLKVGYNKVMGFYIEVSKPNLNLVPKEYERKQTLVNAERFTTPELKEIEYKFSYAEERIKILEKEIFLEFLKELTKYYSTLKKMGEIIADVDVFSNLALIATENNYTKPQITETDEFIVKEGRHPIVEKYLPKGEFVPNDTYMDNRENRIIILTGPNMAGKSTYLRQNALIAIMAHMGSYVPAKECKIGIIDKIFTRIGASDFLALGQSTFLVEMIEVSNILRNATPKSLIVMDEVGRGTSTYDGLSIAWATIDYIANNPQKFGKTLFATHYHELTQLGDDEKRGIKNYTMAVKEYKDEVIFLKKVVKGTINKSYGIFVAQIAGIPDEIIKKAKEILKELEKAEKYIKEKVEIDIPRNIISRNVFQPTLFVPEIPKEIEEIINEIKSLDLDTIKPIEALQILSEIKGKISNIKL
jgi:DNA mismatch repair protein MutS